MNVVAVFVILLSMIPVYIAARLGRDDGSALGGMRCSAAPDSWLPRP